MANISFKKGTAPATSTPAAQKPGRQLSFALFARSFNWFVGFICLVVLFAGFWFLIRPKYALVASNEAVMMEGRVYENKIAYLRELNEIESMYRSISEADKERIDTVLSARQDVDSLTIALLREIGYVARLNGAVTENVKTTPVDASAGKFIDIAGPEKSVPSTPTQIISVSFTLSQLEYPNLMRIMGRLEQSLRLLDVTKIEYNPTLRQAQVELYAYHLAQ